MSNNYSSSHNSHNVHANQSHRAYQDSMRGGRDYYTPEKSIEQYHKKEDSIHAQDQNRGMFTSWLIQWPIQLLEIQMQSLAASKADKTGTNAIVTDVDFRWIGIKNLTTVMISLWSLFFGILTFVLIVLFSGNMLYAYLSLAVFGIHFMFPGYVVTRIKKFIIGEEKTGKLAKIIRKSWGVFEIIYFSLVACIFIFKDTINWINIKASILAFLLDHSITKKFIYPHAEKIPFEYMPKILEYLFNELLVIGIFYLIMLFLTNKTAKAGQKDMEISIAKENMRPTEIIKMKRKMKK
jgi:hypothetical protein